MKVNKEKMLEQAYNDFIFLVCTLCENGREKSVAITNIQTGFLWAKEALKEEDKDEQKD